MARRGSVALVAAAAAATVAGLLALDLAQRTSAQQPSFDCPAKAGGPDNNYICTLTNLTGDNVTDVHIVFQGQVTRVGQTVPATGCGVKRPRPAQNAEQTTEYDCVADGSIEANGTFQMTVTYQDTTGQKRPAHVIDWWWTKNGTPVFTATATPTRTGTVTPTATATPTFEGRLCVEVRPVGTSFTGQPESLYPFCPTPLPRDNAPPFQHTATSTSTQTPTATPTPTPTR